MTKKYSIKILNLEIKKVEKRIEISESIGIFRNDEARETLKHLQYLKELLELIWG